jgi:membrane associated rhomboid family serine protease
MLGMTNRDEVVSPATEKPTPAAVLRLIAKADGQPWFASRHAAETHTDRDALDDPLNRLRVAGLIRVATWVRGEGQGYVLTPEGEKALATDAAIPDTPPDEAATTEVPQLQPDSPAEPEVPPASSLALDPRPALVVPVLLVANLLWFFVGLVLVLRAGFPVWQHLSEGNKEVLHRTGAVSGADLLDGQWWRLASSCFVHIGGAHLLFNLFALVMVGPLAELLWGRWRLAVIYLVSGVAGSCLAMALKPDSLLAGASGAIWGLLMSLVAWFMLFHRYLPADVVADSTRRLMVVIVLNVMFSFLPGISWQGHLGGAVAGFSTAVLLNAMRFGDRWRQFVALTLLLSFAATCAGGLVLAMNRSEPWVAYRQRLADDRTRQAAKLAAEAFDRDVVPLLEQLPPDRVKPLTDRAFSQLTRPGARRNPTIVAELRAKFTELKAAADSAVGHLATPPVGVKEIDEHRGRARAFAEARSRSFALVLAMLDSPAIPDDAAWSEWGKSRRTADALWEQIRKK